MRLGANGTIERRRKAARAGRRDAAGGLARALAAACALLAAGPQPGRAQEAVPMPQVDYAAEGTFAGGGKMLLRHHGGLVRMDMTMPGAGMPMTGYLDLAARKAMMVVATPAGRMAMEVNFADQIGFGATGGQGIREGRDVVAGEPCDIWRIETGRPGEPVHSCITPDGIALRTDATVGGRKQRVFEIAGLRRDAQDLAQFQMPADVPVMRLPMPSPGALPGAAPGR